MIISLSEVVKIWSEQNQSEKEQYDGYQKKDILNIK